LTVFLKFSLFFVFLCALEVINTFSYYWYFQEVKLSGRQQRVEELIRLSTRILTSPETRLANVKALSTLILNIIHSDIRPAGDKEEEEEGVRICLGKHAVSHRRSLSCSIIYQSKPILKSLKLH
jgi:hypothetical protein